MGYHKASYKKCSLWMEEHMYICTDPQNRSQSDKFKTDSYQLSPKSVSFLALATTPSQA